MMGHVVFRADSALCMGSGHVMRCLSLAEILTKRGATCSFLTRAHKGHLADAIRARGYKVDLLPRGRPVLPEIDWLGVPVEVEQEQAKECLDRLDPAWVVLDHYGLGRDWVLRTCPEGARVLVIDDLANRAHQGDLLLDQTLGREPANYGPHWPAETGIMLGAGFCLLHPSFAALREAMSERVFSKGVGRVLVALGGMDAENVTGRIIDILGYQDDIGMTRIDVALGATAPHLDAVADGLAALTDVPTKLHVATPDMAQLMADSDLAIGAGGTMLWERCCLGLPTIALCLAENQRSGLAAAANAKAILLLEQDWEPALIDSIRSMVEPVTRQAVSSAAAQLVDGQGCARAALAMEALRLNCRPAGFKDAERLYHWRQTGLDPAMTLSGHQPSLVDHMTWFDQALADPSRRLLIIEENATPVGHVRLDTDPQKATRVSLLLDPEMRGTGRGAEVLWVGLAEGQRAGHTHFSAEIHQQNHASRKVFERLGFSLRGADAPFEFYDARCGDVGFPIITLSRQETTTHVL